MVRAYQAFEAKWATKRAEWAAEEQRGQEAQAAAAREAETKAAQEKQRAAAAREAEMKAAQEKQRAAAAREAETKAAQQKQRAADRPHPMARAREALKAIRARDQADRAAGLRPSESPAAAAAREAENARAWEEHARRLNVAAMDPADAALEHCHWAQARQAAGYM